MFSPATVIHAKRDGRELPAVELHAFVAGVTDGSVTDAQLGAFTMAVCRRGMSMREQVALTLAMRDSGQVLTWPSLDGPVLDKHSTGGVGDMVSLILGPLLAACGAYVPMISGRGLGHTGGTLDKLESIPGFATGPDLEAFRGLVQAVGVAIVGQTKELAPADRRMYATRDITSTVESVPLIVSSILSKKLAEGLAGLVLDVKAGNGAFMADQESARRLAHNIAAVADHAGLPCTALLTDMNQPLAWSAGNALEVKEVLEFFDGRRHARLEEVTLALAAELLRLGGLAASADEAARKARKTLDSGAAGERFARMVAAQGGPSDLLERPGAYLQEAPCIRPVPAGTRGYVARMDTRSLGLVVMRLGGGRTRVEDNIDHRVGLSGLCSVGDAVETDTPLAVVHAADEDDWRAARDALVGAMVIAPEETPPLPCVYERMTGAG